MVEIDRFMTAGLRRWRMIHLARWACQGAVLGGIAGVAALLAGGGRWTALGLTVAGAGLVPLGRWRQMPGPGSLAALLDRTAGLGSALAAAVEFRHRTDPWCLAQRRYTAPLLAGLDPAALLPWRGSGWLAAAAAAIVAATLLPSGPTVTLGGPAGIAMKEAALPTAPNPALPQGRREISPSPREGDRGRAPGTRSMSTTPTEHLVSSTPPTPTLPRGERELPPSPREGDGGRAPGTGSMSTTAAEHLVSSTAPTPTFPRGGSESDGGPGAHSPATGDIGTAPATTPLLGRPERGLSAPGNAATLALGGGTRPGSIVGPSGLAGAHSPVAAAGGSPTVLPAPPEGVPMHLRAIVAHYFELLHPSPEGDDP
jgi:hypothetical protein